MLYRRVVLFQTVQKHVRLIAERIVKTCPHERRRPFEIAETGAFVTFQPELSHDGGTCRFDVKFQMSRHYVPTKTKLLTCRRIHRYPFCIDQYNTLIDPERNM